MPLSPMEGHKHSRHFSGSLGDLCYLLELITSRFSNSGAMKSLVQNSCGLVGTCWSPLTRPQCSFTVEENRLPGELGCLGVWKEVVAEKTCLPGLGSEVTAAPGIWLDVPAAWDQLTLPKCHHKQLEDSKKTDWGLWPL